MTSELDNMVNRIPLTIIMLLTTLDTTNMRSLALVFTSLANIAPMVTCKKTLGMTNQVAMKNWSNDTDPMLANSEFDQAHGTSEDMRMRMIKGMPFARMTASRACHFSLVGVSTRGFLPNIIRSVVKTITEANSVPSAAGTKPHMPYVKPNK